MIGNSMPSWLTTSNRVLLKCFVKQSKYERDVDEVELLEANPSYAHLRFKDGRETIVITLALAPT